MDFSKEKWISGFLAFDTYMHVCVWIYISQYTHTPRTHEIVLCANTLCFFLFHSFLLKILVTTLWYWFCYNHSFINTSIDGPSPKPAPSALSAVDGAVHSADFCPLNRFGMWEKGILKTSWVSHQEMHFYSWFLFLPILKNILWLQGWIYQCRILCSENSPCLLSVTVLRILPMLSPLILIITLFVRGGHHS